MRRSGAFAASMIALCACGQPESAGPPDADVLRVMSLHESGAGRVSFESMTEQGSAVVFKDVRFAASDGVATAATMRLDGARLENGAPRFDSLTLQGLALEDGADVVTGRVDRLVLENPSPAASGVVAALFGDADGLADAIEGVEPREVTFDALALSGVALSAEDGDGDGQATMTVAEMRAEGFGAQRVESLALTDMAATVDAEDAKVTASIASATLSGLDATMFQNLADALDQGEDASEDEIARALLTSSVFTDVYAKRFDAYAITDLDMDVAGANLTVPSATATVREQGGRLLSTGEAEMTITADAEGGGAGVQVAQLLSMLGYDDVNISVRTSATADPQQDRVTTQEYAVTVEDGFALDLAYDFGGVQQYAEAAAAMALDLDGQADPAAVDPAAALQMYAPLIVHSLGMRVTDAGLTERAFAAAAQTTGQAEDDIRAQASASLLFLPALAPTPGLQTLAQEVAGALGAFISEPGVVGLSLSPQTPVRLGDLIAQAQEGDADIDAIVTALGPSVTYEAPAAGDDADGAE